MGRESNTLTPKQCDTVVRPMNRILIPTSVCTECFLGGSLRVAVNSAERAVNVAMEQIFASLSFLSIASSRDRMQLTHMMPQQQSRTLGQGKYAADRLMNPSKGDRRP